MHYSVVIFFEKGGEWKVVYVVFVWLSATFLQYGEKQLCGGVYVLESLVISVLFAPRGESVAAQTSQGMLSCLHHSTPIKKIMTYGWNKSDQVGCFKAGELHGLDTLGNEKHQSDGVKESNPGTSPFAFFKGLVG